MKRKYAHALARRMGVVAGVRPMTALAILALSLRRGWIRSGHPPFARIVSASASKRIAEFAICELVVDKLPFTRCRLDARPLTWRIVSGAICGAAIHGSGKRPIVGGAVLGGLGSLVGSVTAYHVRQKLGRDMPDLVVALLEDAVTVGAGAT